METIAASKVTPYLLRRADTMCARRLAKAVEGDERSKDPVNRSRVRDAFLAVVREAHAELRAPVLRPFATMVDLVPEERQVLEQAAHWYHAIFGGRPAQWVDAGVEEPTFSRRLGIRLGGWVDLTVVDGDGAKELRQFELWDGRVPGDDPLELDSVRAAVLRLAGWAGDAAFRVVWADLVRGLVRARVVDVRAELPRLREWLDERVAVIRARSDAPTAIAGADCGSCGFVAACPEHPTGAHGSTVRGDLLPGIVSVTPTALDSWHRCRREWRSHHVLQLPASDGDPGTFHGRQVHDLLRLVHTQGSCRDRVHVTSVLDGHGFADDDRVLAEVGRHARRCPDGARPLGHEVTHARFHRTPLPLFMATARIDALWVHDGVLDAHDYKTGQVWSDRVREDRQARLQAWVLEPLARRLGARVRITFEHLAVEVDDDPEPFEPDADDLAHIEEELRATVEAMRAEVAYSGVAERESCSRCRYRSICPDSAAPSEPTWARVEVDHDDAPDAA
ncbi:MAG TPA: PD-(D/E)XK nuclease family protein [Acidimicrobiia bacterium]|nr:PD-(D/E)XK nuclease family protein [Acidimicrobiia bacterium]